MKKEPKSRNHKFIAFDWTQENKNRKGNKTCELTAVSTRTLREHLNTEQQASSACQKPLALELVYFHYHLELNSRMYDRITTVTSSPCAAPTRFGSLTHLFMKFNPVWQSKRWRRFCLFHSNYFSIEWIAECRASRNIARLKLQVKVSKIIVTVVQVKIDFLRFKSWVWWLWN